MLTIVRFLTYSNCKNTKNIRYLTFITESFCYLCTKIMLFTKLSIHYNTKLSN